jgi:hypothetical protein
MVAAFRSVILSYAPIGSRGYARRRQVRRSFAARCSNLVWSTAQPKRHDPFTRCRRLVVAIAIAISAVPVRGCRFADCSFSLESRARVNWSRGGGGEKENGCASGVSRNGRKDEMLKGTRKCNEMEKMN